MATRSSGLESDEDLPEPSRLFERLLATPRRQVPAKESSSNKPLSLSSDPSSTRFDKLRKPTAPQTIYHDVAVTSTSKLFARGNESPADSTHSTIQKTINGTPLGSTDEPYGPTRNDEQNTQMHLVLANELFPPSPPASFCPLSAVSAGLLATDDSRTRRRSVGSIVSDSEGELGLDFRAGQRFTTSQKSVQSEDNARRTETPRAGLGTGSDSHAEGTKRDPFRPAKTPRRRSRTSATYSLDTGYEEVGERPQIGGVLLSESLNRLAITSGSNERKLPNVLSLSRSPKKIPSLALASPTLRASPSPVGTKGYSLEAKAQPKRKSRRITISVISESDEDSEEEAMPPTTCATAAATEGEKERGEGVEIVVAETDDEEVGAELGGSAHPLGEDTILPELEPDFGFIQGYKGMEDVWENDGVLIYDPTPKKRPAKFTSSNPFAQHTPIPTSRRPAQKRAELSPSSPTKERLLANGSGFTSPTKKSVENVKTPKRPSRKVSEIDLTGSSSSSEGEHEKGSLRTYPRPSRQLSTSKPSSALRTYLDPADGYLPSNRLNASPSKMSPSFLSTGKRSTPKLKPERSEKSLAGGVATVNSAMHRPLTKNDRTDLPLALIRQLDREVFRKRWKEASLHCFDFSGSDDDDAVQDSTRGLPEGLEVVWNARLRNTAGRARWKKVRSSSPSKATSTNSTTRIRHECTIELSTKVIDTPHKLRNTLTHELCHIAAWVLSNESKPPHGPAFKLWGQRCMRIVPGLEVTTTHSYQIEYKFRWRCTRETCGKIFGRHSNSINVETHGCPCGSKLVRIDKNGNVKSLSHTTNRTTVEENERGELIQTPVKKKKNAWLEFVASESPRVRKEHSTIAQSEVLKLVAERWKRVKEGSTVTSETELERAMSNLQV